MEQRTWTLNYREGQVCRQGTILATTEKQAEAVGKVFCNEDGRRRFISVKDPILQMQDGTPVDEHVLVTEKAELDYQALTGIERIALNTGRTVEEVLDDMKKKHKVAPSPADEPVASEKVEVAPSESPAAEAVVKRGPGRPPKVAAN